MHVRTATHDDLEQVVTVHRKAVRGVDPGPYAPEQLDAWDHDRDPGDYPLEDPAKHLVVAERDSRVVGFGQVDLSTGEVEAVYVHPDHAGQGVGSALLAAVEQRARQRGHQALEVLASKNAVPFYEAAGYRRVGEETVESYEEMTVVRMRKGAGDHHPRDWGRLPA